jgi:hypothetical protein
MYCDWCGSQLPADQMVCPKCGMVPPDDISTPSLASVKESNSPQEFVLPSYAFGPIMEFSLPNVAIQTQEPVQNSPMQSGSVGTPQAPSGYAQPFPMLAGQVGIGPTAATGRRRLSRGMMILLVAVAVCVICSGIGLIYYVAIAQPEKFYAQATATAQARAKAQARASATAFAQSPQGIFEKATHETPLVNQTLANNDAGLWHVLNQPYGGCGFIGGAYHIRVSMHNYLFYCYSVGYYADFAFQVQMTLLQGSAGGILFHSLGPELNTYVFALTKDGSYLLNMIQNNNVTSTLASNHSPAIRAGLNQANVLTVIMRGSNIYLYANKQFLTLVSDSTLTGGYLGLFVSTDTYTNSADAAFTNETLWD